jgi:hypothetical protein
MATLFEDWWNEFKEFDQDQEFYIDPELLKWACKHAWNDAIKNAAAVSTLRINTLKIKEPF